MDPGVHLCCTRLGSGFCDTVIGGSLHSKYPSWEVDKLVWTPSPTQGFQVKSYYRILRGVVNFFLGKASGKSGSHHGWAFFSWCAALGRILIADNLRKRGTILMEWCYICKNHGENTNCLFLYCTAVWEVCSMIFVLFAVYCVL